MNVLTPLKHVAEVSGRVGWHGLSTDDYLTVGEYLVTGTDLRNGKVVWESCHRVSESRWVQDSRIQLGPGDVLITKDGTIGKIALVGELPGKATLNSGVFRVRPSQHLLGEFLFRVLESRVFTDFVDLLGQGSTINHLYERDVVNLRIPLPSIAEQRTIVDYLDTETARLDALITKKQRMIELLEMRLEVVVARYVNGDARATGIRLRHVSRLTRGSGFPHEYQGLDEGDFPFFKVGDLSRPGNDPYLVSCGNWVSIDTASALRATVVPPGAVMFPKIGAALAGGVRRITTVPSLCDNNVLAVVPTGIEAAYLRYWLSTVDLGEIANPGPVPSLDDDALKDIHVPIADTERQKEVSDQLDAVTAALSSALVRLNRQIELLHEHRQTKITAAVTGELEIPGVVA